MKIRVLSIGKTSTPFIKEGVAFYLKRLEHYCRLEYVELPDVPQKGLTTAAGKIKEAELILKNLKPEDVLVLLDEKGTEYTSRGFANFLQKKMNAGTRSLVFVVGGAFGFSKELYAKADNTLSFSQMTFPHELIRLFVAEQLYRAHTILKGENYHHD
ncbi:MAG TPA: 23S rRNA (pseudouridine(1915)-N(3))-methyltransferase RlmH [Flavobacteriales bacterium]